MVTFNDSAFDSDGVFDSSTRLADLNVMLDGFSFTLADMLFSPQVDYEAQSGELTGLDWSADANVASLSGGSSDAAIASSIGTAMNLFSLFAACQAGNCEYAQN